MEKIKRLKSEVVWISAPEEYRKSMVSAVNGVGYYINFAPWVYRENNDIYIDDVVFIDEEPYYDVVIKKDEYLTNLYNENREEFDNFIMYS